MPDDEFLTPEEVRSTIERVEARNAERRKNWPDMARFFPPIADQLYRQIMERALLGELRRLSLPPPNDDETEDDE